MGTCSRGRFLPAQPCYLFPLPGETSGLMVGRSKGREVRLYCFLPANDERMINAYVNASGNLKVKQPPLVWVTIFRLHLGEKLLEIDNHIYEWKKEGETWQRKAYMIGNVDHKGRVCWGGRYSDVDFQPANPKIANTLFWQNTFNGPYTIGAFHKCRFWSAYGLGVKAPACPEKECQCHLFRCRCDQNKQYREFLVNYTGDQNPLPWEDWTQEAEKLRDRLVCQGARDYLFLRQVGRRLTGFGWADRRLEGGFLFQRKVKRVPFRGKALVAGQGVGRK